MRKYILIFLAIVWTQAALSQTLNIHKSDHSIHSVQLADIDSITFTTTGGLMLLPIHDPILAIQFDEFIYNHNVHIASDGNYLYTVNGGSASVGRIKRYTLDGTFVDSVNIAIDMRSIMYNRADGYLYLGNFGGTIYRLADYQNGTTVMLYPGLLDNMQADPALSWDGSIIYGFNQGTLKRYSLATGTLIDSLTGFQCGANPNVGGAAVAVDPDYIYTWDAATRMVYVYTLAGSFVRSLTLSYGDFGFSLSFVDGYLFVSADGDYATGTWYGYNIRLSTPGAGLIDRTSGTASSRESTGQSDPEDTMR